MRATLAKAKNDKSVINFAEMLIIGSNCHSFMPSLMVHSERKSYLFNCSEGLQRLSYSNKIRLLGLGDAFVTNTNWSNISGVPGLSLTLQDAGCTSFQLHGGEGVQNLFSSTKSFMFFTSNIKTTTHLDGIHQDSGVKVTPIAIDGESSKQILGDTARKKSRLETKLIAYDCLLPDLAGRLDAQKCRELNIPIGPQLALLKKGQDVILHDGRLIRSADVCGSANLGFHFIVLECPSVDDIDRFIENSELNRLKDLRLSQDEREVEMLIHFSPEEVTSHPKYKSWMDGFSICCKHWLLVHNRSPSINFVDSYRMAFMMNTIDPDIFPILYRPNSVCKLIEQELVKSRNVVEKNLIEIEQNMNPESVKESDYENLERIFYANAFDKITIRPKKQLESIPKKFHIDSYLSIAEMNPLFKEEYDKHQRLLSNMPEPQEYEPELVFLGTGSAVPSKLRNTSCILLNLKIPKEVSVMLDCGEDSFGQILRYYGPEKAKEVLKRVKMIYVSHHHADHHIGLIKLIKQRRELTDEPVMLLLPPGIDSLLNYHNDNFEDLSKCYTIFSTKVMKTKPQEPHDSNSAAHLAKVDLLSQLGGLVEDVSIVGVDHCINSCAVVFSFNISRPGMKTFGIAYSGDARPSDDFITIGQECDLLIHEATFDHRSKADALAKKHSTTREAIEVGKKMRAKFTILTHFSQRYAKIPYLNDEFDDKVGFAFDNLTLRCPTHFPRLPILKDLLKVIFDNAMRDIDEKYQKKENKRKSMEDFLKREESSI